MIILDLPLPPPLSSLTTNARKGKKGRVPTDRYKTWKRSAGNEINASRRSRGVQHIPGRVSLSIALSFHDLYNKDGTLSKVRQDISNRIKALEDLIVEHRFVEDDCYVDDIHVYRSWNIERGRVGLFISECNLFEKREAAE